MSNTKAKKDSTKLYISLEKAEFYLGCNVLDKNWHQNPVESNQTLVSHFIAADNDTALAEMLDNGLPLDKKLLFQSVLWDNDKIVRLLVSRGLDIEAVPSGEACMTPFLQACNRGNFKSIKALVELGCDIHAIEYIDEQGALEILSQVSPLQYPITDTLKYLISHGLEIEKYLTKNVGDDTYSLLEFICMQHPKEVVFLLLDNVHSIDTLNILAKQLCQAGKYDNNSYIYQEEVNYLQNRKIVLEKQNLTQNLGVLNTTSDSPSSIENNTTHKEKFKI